MNAKCKVEVAGPIEVELMKVRDPDTELQRISLLAQHLDKLFVRTKELLLLTCDISLNAVRHQESHVNGEQVGAAIDALITSVERLESRIVALEREE